MYRNESKTLKTLIKPYQTSKTCTEIAEVVQVPISTNRIARKTQNHSFIHQRTPNMAKILLEGIFVKRKEQDRVRKNSLVACSECGNTVLCQRPSDVERVLKTPCYHCNDSSREKRELAYELIAQIRSNRKKQAETAE